MLIPLFHPSAGQPLSGHELHFQAILVPVFVSPSLLSSLATMECCPCSKRSSWDSSSHVCSRSLPPAISSHPLSQSLQAASQQGPSVPMGALSQESDTATSCCSSALNPLLSPGQILEHVQTQQNGSDFTGKDVHCKTLMPRPWKWQPNPGL